MLDRILKKIKNFNTVLAINVSFTNEEWEMNAVLATSSNGILEVTDKLKLDTLSQIPVEYLKKAEVMLNLDGKGIISKKIPKEEGMDGVKAANQAFPDIEKDNFYVQSLSDFGHYYISILRMDMLAKVVEKFHANNIFLSKITLGPFVLISLDPLLTESSEELYLGGYLIKKQNDQIIDIETSKSDNKNDASINNEIIGSEYHIPYGLVIGHFSRNLSFEFNHSEFLKNDRSEFLNKWFLEQHFKYVLGGFLGVLLLNISLYFFLYSNNQKLKSAYLPFSASLMEYERLSTETKEQRKLLSAINWGSNQKYAFYADRLAVSLPKEIVWEQVWINPVDEEVFKKEHKEIFVNNVILVTGLAQNPDVLNKWLETIDKADWVLAVYDQNYTYDHKEEKGRFEVKIKF
jgi:hypothetical protein